MESAPDRLILATTQLQMTDETIREHGITADDLGPAAAYLNALADHGYQLVSLALRAVDAAGQTHPIRRAPHGTAVQAPLNHIHGLLDAVLYFAGEAEQAARAISSDDTT